MAVQESEKRVGLVCQGRWRGPSGNVLEILANNDSVVIRVNGIADFFFVKGKFDGTGTVLGDPEWLIPPDDENLDLTDHITGRVMKEKAKLVSCKRRVDRRVKKAVRMYTENKMTIREIAEILGVSKSTVHRDLTRRVFGVVPSKADQVRQMLKINKCLGPIKGGRVTRERYLGKTRGEVAKKAY